MAASIIKARNTWENRFRTPTFEELVAPFSKQLGSLLELARQRLLEYPGIREEIAWQGIPWRWAAVFRWDAEPGRPWAYLIPDPSKPLLVLPLGAEVIVRIPARRLAKPTRDGIVHAAEVAGVHWALWELANRPQLDELLSIAGMKHEMLAAQA